MNLKPSLCSMLLLYSVLGLSSWSVAKPQIESNIPNNTLISESPSICTQWSDFETKGHTEMLIQGSPSASDVQLKGKLVYRPLLIEKHHRWLGFQLFEPENLVDGIRSSSHIYSVPFAVRVNNTSNRIERVIFNAKLKKEDQEKLKGIYATLQLISPDEKDNPKDYMIDDRDDMGTFQLRYQYESDIKGTKSKTGYKQFAWADTTNALAEVRDVIVHSDKLAFEKNECWLSAASGNSDIEVLTEKDFLNLRVQQQIRLKLRQDVPPASVRLLGLPKDPSKWDYMDEQLVYPAQAPNPLASAEQFLKRISGVNISDMPHDDLMQLLYDNQVYLHALKTALLAESFNNSDEAQLFLALGILDEPASHALLTDIYLDEGFRHEARFRTLMALKYAESPIDQKLVDSIFSYANQALDEKNAELAHSSMMVMGIIAKNQLDSEFGMEISARLIGELEQSKNEDNQAALLTAIGNSGDMRHQETLTQYLSNDSSLLRERSANALYHMPGESTLKTLSTQLSTENDARAQQAMLTSMGTNPLGQNEIKQVFDYASKAAESNTRRAAISTLAMQAEHKVDVKPQLKVLMKIEKTEANLRDIMRALYSK